MTFFLTIPLYVLLNVYVFVQVSFLAVKIISFACFLLAYYFFFRKKILLHAPCVIISKSSMELCNKFHFQINH